MSIADIIQFDKNGEVEPKGLRSLIVQKFFLSLIIILVALLSFGIGRLTATKAGEGPVRIEYNSEISNSQFPISNVANVSQALNPTENSKSPVEHSAPGAGIIASKNGSKYHYPHCSGAKQIKEANKITFSSPAAAESAGYTLAANCKPK